MFTLPKAYVRQRGHKKTPNTITTYTGESLPCVPFRPSYLNVEHYLNHRGMLRIVLEHPWIRNVKMFENPAMRDELVKADYETLTVQLSTDLMAESTVVQRDVLTQVLCNFIAQRLFNDVEQGQPYRLLIKRYSETPVSNIKTVGLAK